MILDRRALLASLAAAASPVTREGRPVSLVPTDQQVKKPSSATIPLWPGPAPGSPPPPDLPAPKLQRSSVTGGKEYRLKGIAAPVLFVYRPARPNGAAIIVMPGGGFTFLSIENEGSVPATFFTDFGYTVFVLSYRLPGEGWTNRADAPLQDAIRAMRVVRRQAEGFAVDPDRIAVLGFSAGGHVAASLATDYAKPLYPPVDAADRISARPALVGLMYAVTTMKRFETHSVSRANLLGPAPSAELVLRRSPLAHIGGGTPPCFVGCALDDPIVPPFCSIDWLAACQTAKVPVEGHFFEKGGHGFGLRLSTDNPGALWPELFRLWMGKHGF
ncbi:alpha/beta hydrolase [Sphingomonas oryzagri]